MTRGEVTAIRGYFSSQVREVRRRTSQQIPLIPLIRRVSHVTSFQVATSACNFVPLERVKNRPGDKMMRRGVLVCPALVLFAIRIRWNGL